MLRLRPADIVQLSESRRRQVRRASMSGTAALALGRASAAADQAAAARLLSDACAQSLLLIPLRCRICNSCHCKVRACVSCSDKTTADSAHRTCVQIWRTKFLLGFSVAQAYRHNRKSKEMLMQCMIQSSTAEPLMWQHQEQQQQRQRSRSSSPADSQQVVRPGQQVMPDWLLSVNG